VIFKYVVTVTPKNKICYLIPRAAGTITSDMITGGMAGGANHNRCFLLTARHYSPRNPHSSSYIGSFKVSAFQSALSIIQKQSAFEHQ